jgi:hypothetical protein
LRASATYSSLRRITSSIDGPVGAASSPMAGREFARMLSYRACGFWRACSSCSPECRRASCRRGALALNRESLRGGLTSLLVRAALGVAAGARVWPDVAA